jgi:indolepyruvate ferredoxin oxidoreductase alpha subunit
MGGVESVLCVEELDPVIERELVYLCGRRGSDVRILGKETGDIPASGENTVEALTDKLAEYLSVAKPAAAPLSGGCPPLPARPPVLCAGCPHRASFYAVKTAMKGKKAVFTGDIGCYTLGNAQPLDMVDTCLCMGAGITIAQGLRVAEPDTSVFAFIGDSTFFASGITGIINAVFNKHKITVIILDNRITAMTGGQTHPGLGKTLAGEATARLSIPEILRAIGVSVRVVNPLELDKAVCAVREADAEDCVCAVVFEYPCVNAARDNKLAAVDAKKCVGCGICARELGCPAMSMGGGKLIIDGSLCTGCGLCAGICPKGAIGVAK